MGRRKKLKVAFVEYNKLEPSTGIGNVCVHLKEELKKSNDIDLLLIAPPIRIKSTAKLIQIANKLIFAFWYLIQVPFTVIIKGADLYIETNMLFPAFRFTRLAFFIYDLAFYKYPETILKANYNRRMKFLDRIDLTRDKVFAISKSTKEDVVVYKQITEDQHVNEYNNIAVTELAGSLEVYSQNTVSPISEPYFLFVGTIEPRKNLVNLIQGFYSFVNSTSKEFKFVLIGKRGWLAEQIFEAIDSDPINKDKIVVCGYLSDKELSLYYKNAFAFVFPSLYEGFGLPVLEAMKHGTPVITAHNSSLPEIGEDAVLYCGTEAEEISSAMSLIYKDSQLRTQLIEKGYMQTSKFSWETFGEKVHKHLFK